MYQVIFNEISAAEISRLPTLEQLEILDSFKVRPEDLEIVGGDDFGVIEHKGRKLHRFRAGDYRIYFAIENGHVLVNRVLHRNTLKDFLFRSGLPGGEDEELAKSKHFWKLIDEGRGSSAK